MPIPPQKQKVRLRWGLVADQARPYPSFHSMKRNYSPLDGLLVYRNCPENISHT